jgi:lipid-A-disaccharide synthase-like uncharacterized protein
MSTTEILWIGIGFVGQGMFFGRFVLQWIASERAQRSVVPVAFWWFSLVGSVIVLAYAIYKQDIVFIVGQSTGFIVYTRNLILIQRQRNAEALRNE